MEAKKTDDIDDVDQLINEHLKEEEFKEKDLKSGGNSRSKKNLQVIDPEPDSKEETSAQDKGSDLASSTEKKEAQTDMDDIEEEISQEDDEVMEHKFEKTSPKKDEDFSDSYDDSLNLTQKSPK